MSKSFAFCERCGAKLAEEKIWWLELDQRTGTYSLAAVPEEFSQGGFAFGKDCAAIMIAEHETAQHNAHLTPETQPQSQAVINASALEQSDGDTPPAQAQVA